MKLPRFVDALFPPQSDPCIVPGVFTAVMLAAYRSPVQALDVYNAISISRWQWQGGSVEGAPGTKSILGGRVWRLCRHRIFSPDGQ